MGYSCITKSSFWAAFHNQAILASNKTYSAGFNYNNRFGIKELGTRSAALIVPAGTTSVGAVYSYFGYPDFRRQSAGLACGMRISEKISAGVQVDYFSERTYGEYSNSQLLTFESGLLLQAGKNTVIGIHLFNPLPASLYNSLLPARIRIGAGTNLGTSLFAAAETEMSTGGKMILRTGVEYQTMKKVELRGGFSTENNSFSFGLGYLIDFVQLDIGFHTHEKLGVTSSASLIFRIKK